LNGLISLIRFIIHELFALGIWKTRLDNYIIIEFAEYERVAVSVCPFTLDGYSPRYCSYSGL